MDVDYDLLLVKCLNALDPEATIWAIPSVTMKERVLVVIDDKHNEGKIYEEVLQGITWLHKNGRINHDYTMSRGDVADLLTCTHPNAEVVYPEQSSEQVADWKARLVAFARKGEIQPCDVALGMKPTDTAPQKDSGDDV